MTHAVFTSGVQNNITLALIEFMLDLDAAMARDDYETRHIRQAQGKLGCSRAMIARVVRVYRN